VVGAPLAPTPSPQRNGASKELGFGPLTSLITSTQDPIGMGL